MLTTSSVFGLPGTSSGVFHDELIPFARHTSAPVILSNATSEPLSILALTINRFLYSNGEQPEPQPLVPSPTLACHSSLPSRSKQNTPDLPKKTYSRWPSVVGVLAA